MNRFRPINRTRTGLRRGLVLGTVGVAVAGLTFAITTSASANLTGSTFEGGDANMVVNTSGNKDWANVSPRNGATDTPSGSSDNAFGQGSKEDVANVSVVDGSIPPNKNDLTRFYEAHEQVSGGNIFLDLAWERLSNIGSANLDFEINKNATAGFNAATTGAVTLNRAAGDVLVTYDFGGSGTPSLGLLRWVTSGNKSQCFSASALPCWGNRVDLTAAGFAEGAVNTVPIAESVAGGTLGVGLFGEAAINLTAAGVFQSGVCTAFGTTFVKSRSSASFTAEIKDFIAPVPVNISNCGSITIHKVTENANGTFGYTTTGSFNPTTFSLTTGGTAAQSTQSYANTTPGSYSVTENLTAAQVTAGWTLKSLSCTSAGSGTSTSVSASTVSITEGFGGVVDCTYTNHINAHPTVSTTLSGTTVNIGDPVHDSAILTGATTNAGGTVTYTAYTDSACSQGARDAGTKNVTAGVVTDSNPLTFSSAGDYYWQAVYSGDPNNDSMTSACTDEHLLVKTNPHISTTLSANPVDVGDSVFDSAALSGATSDAGGTVTYTVYTDSACSQGARDAGTKNVNAGVVTDSNTLQFNSAGDFYWQAVYSGDPKNNSATSVCTEEHLVVNPKHTSASTAQSVIPNDSFTLSGATSGAGGSITFSLYAPGNTMCIGTPALTQTVSVSGSGTYKTTNTSFVASAAGTWRWASSYTGDGNNTSISSACGVENFTIVNT
jgi:uncharacterized protein (DUF2237 family)